MRQTLFYIVIDNPFLWGPQGTPDRPILHVGLAYLILLLLAGTTAWMLWQARRGGSQNLLRALAWNGGQFLALGVLLFLISPIRIFPVYGYGTMLLLGFVSGASWAGRRAVRVGIPRDVVWDVAMLILVCGILGARSFYLIQYGGRVFANARTPAEYLLAAVNLQEGGLVLYGGVILGTLAYFAFCYVRKLHPLELADVITPSIFLGLGFGRIGCLLNGCCFGDRCDLPWAITFPPGSVPYETLLHLGFLAPDAAASLPLHPSQIYSSIGGFLLAIVTATVFRYRRKIGEVLAVGAIFYPINRFFIEFVRGDEFTQFDTGLTISQLVSVGVLVASVAYLSWLEIYGRPAGESSLITRS